MRKGGKLGGGGDEDLAEQEGLAVVAQFDGCRGGQVPAGTVPGQSDARGVHAECGGVAVEILDGGEAVLHRLGVGMFRGEPVVHGHDHHV